MKLFCFLLLTLVVFPFELQAQKSSFEPQKMDLLQQRVESIHSNFIKQIGDPNSREIKKYYKNFDQSFIKKIEDGNFWFNKEIENHLENILKKIYASNSEFKREEHLWLIDRSLIPNAACYGNGIFVVNAGLFLQNQSDDEIAFIICHELAHFKLTHSLKRISSIVETLDSDETKDRISAAKKKRYGSTRAGLAILDDLSTNILDHSKEAENEADAIGLKLYQNTLYKNNSASVALSNLGDFDKRMESYKIRLDTIFTTKDYPFKKSWTEKSISLFENDTNLNDFTLKSDTLETHPDIKNRITRIQEITEGGFKETTEIIGTHNATHNLYQKILLIGIEAGELDFSLLAILKCYESGYITRTEYLTLINQLLLKLIELKQSHELGKNVDAYKSKSDYKALNEIRNFLHNISHKNAVKLQIAYQNENR